MNNKGYSSVAGSIIAIIVTLLIILLANQIYQSQVDAVIAFKKDVLDKEEGLEGIIAEERLYNILFNNISYKGDPSVLDGDNGKNYIVFEDLGLAYKINEVDERKNPLEISNKDRSRGSLEPSLTESFDIDNETDILIDIDISDDYYDKNYEVLGEDYYILDKKGLFEVEITKNEIEEDGTTRRIANSPIDSRVVKNKKTSFKSERYGIGKKDIYNPETDETNYGKYGVKVTPNYDVFETLDIPPFVNSEVDIKVRYNEIERDIKLTEYEFTESKGDIKLKRGNGDFSNYKKTDNELEIRLINEKSKYPRDNDKRELGKKVYFRD